MRGGKHHKRPREVTAAELIAVLVEAGAKRPDADSTVRVAVELDLEVFAGEAWYKVKAKARYGTREADSGPIED